MKLYCYTKHFTCTKPTPGQLILPFFHNLLREEAIKHLRRRLAIDPLYADFVVVEKEDSERKKTETKKDEEKKCRYCKSSDLYFLGYRPNGLRRVKCNNCGRGYNANSKRHPQLDWCPICGKEERELVRHHTNYEHDIGFLCCRSCNTLEKVRWRPRRGSQVPLNLFQMREEYRKDNPMRYS